MRALRFSFLLNFILCQKQVPAQLGFLPSVPRGLENIKEGVGGQSRDTGTRRPPNTGTPGSLQQRGSLWLLTAPLPFKASLHKEVPSQQEGEEKRISLGSCPQERPKLLGQGGEKAQLSQLNAHIWKSPGWLSALTAVQELSSSSSEGDPWEPRPD